MPLGPGRGLDPQACSLSLCLAVINAAARLRPRCRLGIGSTSEARQSFDIGDEKRITIALPERATRPRDVRPGLFFLVEAMKTTDMIQSARSLKPLVLVAVSSPNSPASRHSNDITNPDIPVPVLRPTDGCGGRASRQARSLPALQTGGVGPDPDRHTASTHNARRRTAADPGSRSSLADAPVTNPGFPARRATTAGRATRGDP